MYVPRAFQFGEEAAQHAFIDRFGFATLVSVSGEGMQASHVPLLLDRDRKVLVGHMARANPHTRLVAQGMSSLAIFHGPHGYVSPRWYGDEVSVPTWNYSAVHVHGALRLVDDAAALGDSLRRLVRHFDGDAQAALLRAERAMPQLLPVIVGFELSMARIEGKHKLSQNRSNEDRAGVYAGLCAEQGQEGRVLAAWMAELGLVDVEVGA